MAVCRLKGALADGRPFCCEKTACEGKPIPVDSLRQVAKTGSHGLSIEIVISIVSINLTGFSYGTDLGGAGSDPFQGPND